MHAPSPTAPFNPRRVLVTGGAGFIGSTFVSFVLRERPGVEVVNLDKLTYAGNLNSLGDALDDPRHTFVRGDIVDRETVLGAIDGCDSVVNFAAESHVDRSIMDSGPFIETNVRGTQVLLDAAREAGVGRFVQIGTDEVYGSLPLDRSDLRFTEDSPLEPNSPYAASKAAADLLVRAYHHTFGLPAIITRCSNNFGPYQFPEKVIPLFVLNLLRGKRVPLYGDGLNVRDWIHVEDHAEALLAVLERGRPGEVYNIGADNERSNLELTRTLLELTGRDDSFIEYVTDRPGHDRRYAIDSSKAQREIGWKPTRSVWPEALTATVEWYRDNEQWWSAILSGEYRDYYERQYGIR
jgi:dTDP-glucose 4,6-dehydratase